MTRLLSDNDVRRFKDDGVVHCKSVLTPKEVDKLRAGVSNQMRQADHSATAYDFEQIARSIWGEAEADAGQATRLNLGRLASAVKSDGEARPLLDDGEGGQFFYDVAGWRSHKDIRDVAMDSILPEICFELLGGGYVNFWEDTTFVKAPGTRQRTAFHQDLTYSQSEGQKCAIVWVPLDPANLENGVLQYVRGSHRWGRDFAPNVFVSQTPIAGSQNQKVPDIEANPDQYDIISFDVEPGDVVIHDVRTLHGAGGNQSNQYRRAISFRYCGEDMRYLDRPGAVPEVQPTHTLNDGDRLFTKDHPIVYPKPWPDIKLSDWYERDHG